MFELFRCTKSTIQQTGVVFLFLFLLALILSGIGSTVTGVFAAPAPVIDATAQGSTIKEMQQRIKRLENRFDNQGLIELIKRVDSLQMEVQRLVGNVEVQSHELKGMQKRQRDVYSDLDNRIRKLEQVLSNGAGAAGGVDDMSSVSVVPATGIVSGHGDSNSVQPQVVDINPIAQVDQNVARSAYERAFNMLKQGRYKLAISLFDAFLETYPNASYADNAQYWLGEANYATRKFKVALSEFKKVIDQYPNSPKRADALLKMGYTYGELGDKRSALQTLNTLVKLFPNSTAARLAKKRIQRFNSDR
ncbi:MAG: tol-pal system protein YbgF [Gammaproteobacteria bacterium]|nr:tol-pal system protein YbgF [Gammaproteobacteria bacterium]